ncbi:hypothetical protein JAAARDRAFT_33732 [Jaapia argillacea MUCL 33604]|uniref:Uncharacterized protein n=1 Tax=Jaapia argillacea MUCL 33604 TaxID=933084 RepID=A0A067PW12_9AGAM|nr:hypothetical protein JAAARDRAFT_33732 [Jaapia argillacea MUCL 33604]
MWWGKNMLGLFANGAGRKQTPTHRLSMNALQLEDFHIEEMAATKQELAPQLWKLPEILLSADEHLARCSGRTKSSTAFKCQSQG